MARHWGEHEGDDHPHMEITQAIIGAAIRVQSALGPGLLEDAYKLCLAHALRTDGHKVLGSSLKGVGRGLAGASFRFK